MRNPLNWTYLQQPRTREKRTTRHGYRRLT